MKELLINSLLIYLDIFCMIRNLNIKLKSMNKQCRLFIDFVNSDVYCF